MDIRHIPGVVRGDDVWRMPFDDDVLPPFSR